MKNMKNMNKKTLAALSLVAIMATTSIGAFASTDSGTRGDCNEKGTRTATMEKKTSDVKAVKVNHATMYRTIARTTIGGIEHNLFKNHGTFQTLLVAEKALLRDKAMNDKDKKNEKSDKMNDSDWKDNCDKNENLNKAEKAKIAANLALMTTLKPLYLEIDAMKAAEKAVRDASNTSHSAIKLSIKTLSKTLKGMTPEAAKFAWNDLKMKIAALSVPIDAKNVEIHNLHKTMKAEWVVFNTAVLANNEEAAKASLTRIVAIKKDINVKHAEMTALKVQLAKFLANYAFPVMPVTLTPAA